MSERLAWQACPKDAYWQCEHSCEQSEEGVEVKVGESALQHSYALSKAALNDVKSITARSDFQVGPGNATLFESYLSVKKQNNLPRSAVLRRSSTLPQVNREALPQSKAPAVGKPGCELTHHDKPVRKTVSRRRVTKEEPLNTPASYNLNDSHTATLVTQLIL